MQHKQLSISMKKTYFRNPLPQLITFPFSVIFIIVAVMNIRLCTNALISTTTNILYYINQGRFDTTSFDIYKRYYFIQLSWNMMMIALQQQSQFNFNEMNMTRIEWIDSNTLANMIKTWIPCCEALCTCEGT